MFIKGTSLVMNNGVRDWVSLFIDHESECVVYTELQGQAGGTVTVSVSLNKLGIASLETQFLPGGFQASAGGLSEKEKMLRQQKVAGLQQQLAGAGGQEARGDIFGG